MTRFQTVVAVVALTLSNAGCGKSVAIAWWEPSADVGAADTVVVTDAYGRDDAVESVARITRTQIEEHGYFKAFDRHRRVRLESNRKGDVWLDDGNALAANTIYMRVDVLEWDATTVDEVTTDEATGEELTASTTYAHVLLSLTAADDRGLLVDELEVGADSEQEGALDDEAVAALLDTTAAQVLHEGLADLLPTRKQASVALENDGDLDDALVDVDNLRATDARLTTFLAAHPNHAAAEFDRAVVRDALGDYGAALNDYDDAIAQGGDESWRAARAGCIDRREAARALGRTL